VVQQDGFEEFYDLYSDPSELVNLAGDNAHEETLAVMRAGLASAMRQSSDDSEEAYELLSLLEA
jgi:hypothetical protein